MVGSRWPAGFSGFFAAVQRGFFKDVETLRAKAERCKIRARASVYRRQVKDKLFAPGHVRCGVSKIREPRSAMPIVSRCELC